MSESRICTKCREDKPVESYGYRDKEKTRLHSWCKPCMVVATRRWAKENQDAVKKWRRSPSGTLALFKNKCQKIGLSQEETARAFAAFQVHDGVCDICGKSPREKGNKRGLNLDQCHDKMVFRGFLCSQCNITLGCVKDSQEVLHNAILYLDRTGR